MSILWSVVGIMVPGFLLITHVATNDWAVVGLVVFANVVGYVQGIFHD